MIPIVLLVKATEKIAVGSPLTTFVPHAVEALLNSQHTQHLSVSHLTSSEVLWLTAPHITLLHCNNLKPATLLRTLIGKVPHNCFMLTEHLLTPCDNLQEMPLGNNDFSWFTYVSYLKGDNIKR